MYMIVSSCNTNCNQFVFLFADDPYSFIINILEQCLEFRDNNGEPPLLFEPHHQEIVYRGMDPGNTGKITYDQYCSGKNSGWNTACLVVCKVDHVVSVATWSIGVIGPYDTVSPVQKYSILHFFSSYHLFIQHANLRYVFILTKDMVHWETCRFIYLKQRSYDIWRYALYCVLHTSLQIIWSVTNLLHILSLKNYNKEMRQITLLLRTDYLINAEANLVEV